MINKNIKGVKSEHIKIKTWCCDKDLYFANLLNKTYDFIRMINLFSKAYDFIKKDKFV